MSPIIVTETFFHGPFVSVFTHICPGDAHSWSLVRIMTTCGDKQHIPGSSIQVNPWDGPGFYL